MATKRNTKGNKDPGKVRRSIKGEGKTAERQVVIAFRAPEAKRVCLAGDFNQWDTESMRLRKSKDGTWKRKIRLQPGRYEYRLLADGDWVHDVQGAEAVPNAYGTLNCVIHIK
jgi:1,4-alpha-glucan branching enzyme